MESQIKSSFIPQDVGREPTRRRVSAGSAGDLFVLGAIIILIASVSLAIAVFLYTQYMNTTIANKQASIDRARAAIEPALIEELSRLDARMRSSGILLGIHVAPSILFDVLQQITLQSVQLTALDLTTDAPDSIKITMQGLARSVNSIALQSDLYGKSGLITSPIFSDINRQDGGMHFKVDALINPSSFHYSRLVEAQNGTVPQTQNTQPLIQSSAPGAGTTTESGPPPAFTPIQ